MGEDFPLDPNQVQPPQEEQTTHIEVTSHENDSQIGGVALSENNEGQDDTRVEDVEKAQVMAEAGDENRTKAALNRNAAQLEVDAKTAFDEAWNSDADSSRQLYERSNEAQNAADVADRETKERFKEDGHYFVGGAANRAKKYDALAEKAEVAAAKEHDYINGFLPDGTQPTYEQDVDKARVMAEAGSQYRVLASAKDKFDLPKELQQQYQTFLNERAYGEDGALLTAREVFEKRAEFAEERAAKDYEAAKSSNYSHDVEKAMRMMRAERARKTNLAEKTPLGAGNQYDLERAEKEVGKSLAEVLEATKESSDKAIAFLRFSHSIAEQYRRVGDNLTPNLEALDLAYKFTAGWSHKTLQEYGYNKWVQVALDADKGGAISITKDGEKWRVPMSNSDPNGHNHRSTMNDSATYEVNVNSPDPDEQFDRVQVRKVRSLGEADVDNLKKAFGQVKAFDAHKRANTLYPGDEGYEEELAEINYGRDL